MRTLHHHTLALAAFAGSLLFASCSNTPAEQKEETDKKLEKIEDKMADSEVANTPKTWEIERNEILEDLRGLRNNIDAKLAETNVKLADTKLKPSERKAEEAMKAELTREKDTVEDLIKRSEDSTDTTWETVKADIKKGADDVKTWWARQKENVDKKTDADHDKDGH